MIGEGYTLFNMIQIDETIFDNIELYEKIDKELCLTQIFIRCGNLPTIDFSPELYKKFVEAFFKKNYNVFKNLYDSMFYEYEPLENLNRYDENQRISENSRNTTSESHGTNSNVSGIENTISAMDSSDYQPDRKTDSDSTTSSDNNLSGNETENGKDTFTAHSHGTIGVITSQDMIEKQRRVVRYNFYDEVAELYEREMCVSIY